MNTSINCRGVPTRRSSCRTASRAASLATNPSSGITPAIEAAARIAMTANSGCLRPKPERSKISRVPVEWSIAPTTINSVALNSECATVSARPASMASREPMATTEVIKPSWETVP